MEEEQGYHHFLQSVFTEELYLISEPENDYKVEEKKESDAPSVEPVKKSLTIEEKDSDEIVFVLKESLSKDISIRFNTMLEKLGLTSENTNIVYLTSYPNNPEIEPAIFQLTPDKFVFLGTIEAIKSIKKEEDFTSVTLNDKKVLAMPDFSIIVKEKEQVLRCWQVLKEFLEVNK